MTKAVQGLTLTEDELLHAVVQYAQLRRCLVSHFRPARTATGWRTPIQGDQGFVDVVVAKAGRVLFAELKSQRGRTTPQQDAWVAAVGGRVWRPQHWFDGTIRREIDRITR